MSLTPAEFTAWVGTFMWTFVRISAMFAAAPIFASRMVPVRVRLALGLFLSWILLPMIPHPEGIGPFSVQGLIVTVHQVLIGLTMGFILQLVFSALAMAGESVGLSMGLGFASMVDPQNGTQVPVISSYYGIVATLLFMVLNGHLTLIGVLAESFESLPIGINGLARGELWMLVGWGSRMFAGAVLIALPALASLLMVNIAFGVITRAAPQLNIFAVGFPVTLLLGLVFLLLATPALTAGFTELLFDGFNLVRDLTRD